LSGESGATTTVSSPSRRCYYTGVRRPRFVVVLCAAALATALLRVVDVLRGAEALREIFGTALQGDAARLVAVLEAITLAVGAYGLWRLRPWARIGAMVYLAAVVVSFLFFGAPGDTDQRAVRTLFWQVSMVPFATFCFMFLYNGERHFAARPRPPTT
jgi:hypothetical protein